MTIYIENPKQQKRLLVDFPLSFVYVSYAAAADDAKSLQSCPTLCNPVDGSPSGSPVPGILHERVLEWGAIAFSDIWA